MIYVCVGYGIYASCNGDIYILSLYLTLTHRTHDMYRNNTTHTDIHNSCRSQTNVRLHGRLLLHGT